MTAKLRTLSLLSGLFVLFSLPSMAQTAAQTAAEAAARANALRVPQTSGVQGQPRVLPTTILPAQKAPASSKEGGSVVTLKSIRIEGNTVISQSDILAVLVPYAEQQFNFAQLQALAKKVETLYRQKGYVIAQAYLPKQKLGEGNLLIRVVEGFCEKVNVTNKSFVIDSKLEGTFVQNTCRPQTKTTPPQVINVVGLERAALLVNDLLVSELPGLVDSPVKTTLSEGKTIGGTILSADVAKVDRVQGFVSLDNFGSQATGENVLSSGIDINSPLKRGDRLSLRANSSGTGLTAFSADYNYPIGYDGWRVGGNISHIKYVLKDFNGASGTSGANGLYVRYPLIRRVLTNFEIKASYTISNSTDTLPTGSQSKVVSTAILGASGDSTSTSGAKTGYSLNLVGGTTKLDAQVSDPNGINGAFTKLVYGANRTQPLFGNVSAFLNVRGQAAGKNLDSSQKLSLGGSSAVRAFNGEGSVDSGNIANLELRYRTFFGSNYQMVFSVFYDYGKGQYWVSPAAGTPGSNDVTLSGQGLGMVLSKGGRYSLSIYHATQGEGKSEATPPVTGYTWVQGAVVF